MAAWTAAARQVANIARLSTSRSAASSAQASILVQRRGLAGGGDHHGPPKVNFWQDPMSPSKWKEEHDDAVFVNMFGVILVIECLFTMILIFFVIVSLTGWGLLIFGGYKLFTGGKKDKKEEKVEEAH